MQSSQRNSISISIISISSVVLCVGSIIFASFDRHVFVPRDIQNTLKIESCCIAPML